MHHSLEHSDNFRLKIGPKTDRKQKSALGQFMTPSTIANFMASLFSPSNFLTCRLLDPGAGIGSLSYAFIERWKSGGLPFRQLELTACEIDNALHKHLLHSMTNYIKNSSIQLDIEINDFIDKAINYYLPQRNYFTHAILNPPYKKINNNSHYRLLLRQVGIETVNLYSAFVAVSLMLLVPKGQLVAIIPRSFCNGPYYRSFREFILNKAAIKHIHLFIARNKAFEDDNVLQENLLLLLERDGEQGKVTISTSTDNNFYDYTSYNYNFDRIVYPNDPEKFIHIPTSQEKSMVELSSNLNYSLSDLGVNVSTGPIVDFRVREYIKDMPELNTVPLLYPGHLIGISVKWPNLDIKKPNAIVQHLDTEKLLYPSGFYTIIKRFSSKEEKKRIMASFLDPSKLPGSKLGFENHLNILHQSKQGLPELLARGLTIFLNSSCVDNHFRQFSGHTQVNATDLRLMRFPSRDMLLAIGKWSKLQNQITQLKIDDKIETIL